MTIRPVRGQTLVLFALTMMLLTVMVCLTLSIGMKVREKIELQTLADSTAFSNATTTARVFNTISVWNRAQVSHMVVLAGAQSHIDYASWYLAAVHATEAAAIAAGVLCAVACADPLTVCICPTCVNVGLIANEFNTEYNTRLTTFKNLDQVAGLEARALQGQAYLYGLAGKDIFAEHAIRIGTGGLAKDILDLAVLDPTRRAEYKVSTTANTVVSAMELARANQSSMPYPSLPATHGTRLSDFTRNRGGVVPPVKPPTLYLKHSGVGGVFSGSGAGYFGTGMHDASVYDGKESWADDEGWQSGGIVWGGCLPWVIPPTPANSHLKSTHSADSTDEHDWFTGSPHNAAVDTIHTMGSCGASCPSVWIRRQEFNIDPDSANNAKSGPGGVAAQWNQPKVYAGIERDYDARNNNGKPPDPWNLMFKFRFSPTDTSSVDIGKQNSMQGKFKTQLALATGITYYHRHMQNTGLTWAEPPNFFNPFWRATLVPADIDNTATADLTATLGAADPSYAAAYLALKAAGFKGFQ